MRTRALLFPLLLAGGLSAQNIIETFPFPNGTLIPGWTQQNLTWKIQNQRLVPTGGRSFHYITNDRIKDVKDCVLDVEVIYPTVQSLHAGGLCARHPGGSGENGLVQLKLQDNSGSGTGAYNTLWLYERPGSSVYTAVSPPTKRAVVRLFIKGNQAWAELDGDMDGIFELKSAVKTFSNAATKSSGKVGITGYNGAEMDNWKYYAGIVMAASGSTPKIGTTYTMELFTPLNGGSTPIPTPWAAMLSLGNKGIPIPDGRAVPLSLDWLWVNSLGFGWGGVMTTQKPTARFGIAIPNDPVLVGIDLFAAAITLDGTKSFGIGAISNDHHFQITP